jgi:hypothetical protein
MYWTKNGRIILANDVSKCTTNCIKLGYIARLEQLNKKKRGESSKLKFEITSGLIFLFW